MEIILVLATLLPYVACLWLTVMLRMKKISMVMIMPALLTSFTFGALIMAWMLLPDALSAVFLAVIVAKVCAHKPYRSVKRWVNSYLAIKSLSVILLMVLPIMSNGVLVATPSELLAYSLPILWMMCIATGLLKSLNEKSSVSKDDSVPKAEKVSMPPQTSEEISELDALLKLLEKQDS